jgi:hypothetical protein
MKRAAIALVAAGVAAAFVVVGELAARTHRAGTAIETSFYSHGVRGRVHLSVYLPAGYERERYPVVYFLHGLPAGSRAYQGFDFLQLALDKVGKPAIFVAAQGARDSDSDPEYLDWGPGRNWETAVGVELPRFVDSRFRTIRSRRCRAIVGLSARLRRHAARAPPPRRVRRRRVLERLLPPDEPERDGAARRRLGRRERSRERPHVRQPAPRRVQPPSDILRVLRRRGRHALPR